MSTPSVSRLRRRVALAATTVALLAPACTSDTARFCEELRDVHDLSALSEAISARDVRGINTSLEQLRAVQDVAPEEIHDDFRTLIDVLADTVRIVTETTDPAGNTTPVDPSTLTDQLAKISEPAHNVADYADRYCGIELLS